MPAIQSLESAALWVLLIAAASCLLRACAILRFRVPAKAKLVHDGYRRARRDRNAAVFLRERAPMPLTVEDVIAFATRDGQAVRVTIRRWAAEHDDSLLIWYSPSDPRRVTATGPLSWAVRGLAALGTAAWLYLS